MDQPLIVEVVNGVFDLTGDILQFVGYFIGEVGYTVAKLLNYRIGYAVCVNVNVAAVNSVYRFFDSLLDLRNDLLLYSVCFQLVEHIRQDACY